MIKGIRNYILQNLSQEEKMSRLKKQVQDKIEAWRPRTTRLVKEFGNVKVGGGNY